MTSQAFPITIARVYDTPDPAAGARLLVDRLWPRGIAKADLPLDDWPKDITPSNELRKWFHADPTRWPEFQTRYRAELATHPEAVARCLDWCGKGPVVLLTASRDLDHSQAPVLRDYLAEQCATGSKHA